MTTNTTHAPHVPGTAGAVLLAVGPRGHMSSGTVEFAVRTATGLGLGIEVVHVLPTPGSGPIGTWDIDLTVDELVRQGKARLDTAVERVRQRMGGAQPVTGHLLRGHVIDTLVDLSARAALVVLERRQVGRWARLMSGSVTASVAARSHAPVVSVPARWRPTDEQRPITVAIGDATRAQAELWTAFGISAISNQPVRVLRALHPRPESLDEARRVLSRDAGVPADLTAHLPCTFEVRGGRPTDVLVEATHDSSLLVMARRDPVLPLRSHLGPVVARVLRASSCPVLVVEPTLAEAGARAEGRGESGPSGLGGADAAADAGTRQTSAVIQESS